MLCSPRTRSGARLVTSIGETRRDGQELRDLARRFQDLFEVVEDQQERPVPEMVLQALPDRPLPPALADPEGCGDLGDHPARIDDRRQVHEPHAVGEVG